MNLNILFRSSKSLLQQWPQFCHVLKAELEVLKPAEDDNDDYHEDDDDYHEDDDDYHDDDYHDDDDDDAPADGDLGHCGAAHRGQGRAHTRLGEAELQPPRLEPGSEGLQVLIESSGCVRDSGIHCLCCDGLQFSDLLCADCVFEKIYNWRWMHLLPHFASQISELPPAIGIAL